VERPLGTGRYTEVDEIVINGNRMARKRVFVYNSEQPRILRIKKEIASLKQLSHPHIVRLLKSYEEEEGNNGQHDAACWRL